MTSSATGAASEQESLVRRHHDARPNEGMLQSRSLDLKDPRSVKRRFDMS